MLLDNISASMPLAELHTYNPSVSKICNTCFNLRIDIGVLLQGIRAEQSDLSARAMTTAFTLIIRMAFAALQALSLFHQAVSEGHFRQQSWDSPDVHRAEVNLHAMTAGVAMLSLYTWLIALKHVTL